MLIEIDISPRMGGIAMGLLRRGRRGAEARWRRYVMRERLLDIGDGSWIESGEGERVFKVNGKALLRLRDTSVIESPNGDVLAKIRSASSECGIR